MAENTLGLHMSEDLLDSCCQSWENGDPIHEVKVLLAELLTITLPYQFKALDFPTPGSSKALHAPSPSHTPTSQPQPLDLRPGLLRVGCWFFKAERSEVFLLHPEGQTSLL